MFYHRLNDILQTSTKLLTLFLGDLLGTLFYLEILIKEEIFWNWKNWKLQGNQIPLKYYKLQKAFLTYTHTLSCIESKAQKSETHDVSTIVLSPYMK